MKKTLTPLFMRSVAMIALLLAASTSQAYDFMYNGIAYNYVGDGTSVYVTFTDSINNYSSNYSTIINAVIPEKIVLDGNVTYNVIAIDDRAFLNATKLTSVTIPKSIQSIGVSAFDYCPELINTYISSIESWCKIKINSSPFRANGHLYVNGRLVTEIEIPSTITEITSNTFFGAPITSVSIPSSVKNIGKFAFARCFDLEKVKISDLEAWCKIDFYDVTSNPLYYARNLYLNGNLIKKLTIPSTISSIKDYAFIKSTITTLIMPNSVEHIGDGSFFKCENLSSITFGNQLKTIGSENGENVEYGAFDNCASLTSITIPNTVTSIGVYAFYKCEKLEEINMPTSLSIIKNYAFSKCTSLKGISFPSSLKTIEGGAFKNCAALTSLTIPKHLTTIGDNAFNGCDKISAVSIPNGCTVGSLAFANCNSLQSVTIPETLTYQSNIFQNCNNIKKLTWNAANLTSQFVPTSNIEQVTIGSGVVELPVYFLQNAKITTLSLPASITTIGSYAFYNCSNLSSLTIPENLTSIGSNAFSGCNNITQLTWNAINLTTNGGITTSNITKVTIGNKVQNIPEYFVSSSKITSVSIPSSITTIGECAFVGCKGLTSLNIPDNVTTIGQSAFNGCSNLTKLILGKGLTTIRDYAFQGTNIVVLRIPESVTSVGWCAFYNQNKKIVKIYNASNLGLSSSWFRDEYHLPLVRIGKGSGYNVNLDPNTSFEVDGITYVITDMTNRKVKIVDVNETKCASDIEVKKVKYRNVEFTPTELGTAALAGNFTVKSFKFGDVTTIPSYTFYESALTKAEIPNSITSVDQHAFENCKRMTEFVVGTGVNTIDQFVLTGCSALRRVELGSNVASISANSFNGCSKIKTLRVRRTTPPNATSGVFNDLDKWSCTLYVPKGTVNAYKNADEWKTFFFISDDETEPSDGDVNGDGKVNVSDVTALINMIMGITTMDEASADVNGDGKVNVSDVSALINIILGIN